MKINILNQYRFLIVLNLIVIIYFIVALISPYVDIGKFSYKDVFYNFFIYILVSPIIEEFIFRGIILKELSKKFTKNNRLNNGISFKNILNESTYKNINKIKYFKIRILNLFRVAISKITLANVLSSLIFVFVHFVVFVLGSGFSINLLLESMLFFIPSIFLGIIYELYKNLYFAIEFHMLLNFNVFLVYIF